MSSAWSRIIIHVDMDAFFASVEELLNPEWRGKAVIVGADPDGGRGRGVVSAASYEARKFGVHSAMPISQAYRLCPQGIYVRPHGHVYSDYSKRFFQVLHTFSPLVEDLSIDEAFLDMSGSLHLFGTVEELGKRLKEEIFNQTGLKASVGIAPVKSVAKIASDLNKPDGLTIVPSEAVQSFLDELPVTRLWGIGKKTSVQLQKLGIHTVLELRRYPRDILEKKFGKMGIHIHKMALGEDSRPVSPEEEVKSVSNEVTFEEDTNDADFVRQTIFTLSEKVGGRLRRSHFRGRTVQLKIRFSDFKTHTRSYTLQESTHLTEDIFQTVEILLAEFLPLEQYVRLVGVGVSSLKNEAGAQLSIWDADNQKKLKMEKILDALQDKFGSNIIRHAESLPFRSPKKKNP